MVFTVLYCSHSHPHQSSFYTDITPVNTTYGWKVRWSSWRRFTIVHSSRVYSIKLVAIGNFNVHHCNGLTHNIKLNWILNLLYFVCELRVFIPVIYLEYFDRSMWRIGLNMLSNAFLLTIQGLCVSKSCSLPSSFNILRQSITFVHERLYLGFRYNHFRLFLFFMGNILSLILIVYLFRFYLSPL
jgi:hypothetical protein